jgi:formylmethanofuran dehydrogenase subunit E
MVVCHERIYEYFDTAMKFHGHKCPAMPMGLRAGLAAMKALGVERLKDMELFVEAETGKGHAAGCFLDGLMTAKGMHLRQGEHPEALLQQNGLHAYRCEDRESGLGLPETRILREGAQFALCPGEGKGRATAGYSRCDYGGTL